MKEAKELKKIANNIEDAKKNIADCSLEILRKQNEAELKCVTDVLKEYLGREPKEEDFKNCTRIIETEYSSARYMLCHLSTKLGLIEHHYFNEFKGVVHNGEPVSFRVSFNPDITEFQK